MAIFELVISDTEVTSPRELVQIASKEKKEAVLRKRRSQDPNDLYDQVWCIFDVDEHPHLLEACIQAKDNGVALAISNPCFELWLLLHFESQTAMIGRHDALARLTAHIPGYRKGACPIAEIKGKFSDAMRRAKQLEAKHVADGTTFPNDNPSSSVWKLVEDLGFAY